MSLALSAAGCGTAATVAIPATATLSLPQAVQRLCDAGLRVRILESSTPPGPAHPARASRVVVTGTTPAAGTQLATHAVVDLRVEAPIGTFTAIRLPDACQAPTGTATG